MNCALKPVVMALAVLAGSASAFAAPLPQPGTSPHVPTGPRPVKLGRRAKRAAAEQWARTGIAPPLVGLNGEVEYAYGVSRPVVRCAPLHLCVVALLKGEKIVNLSLGDSVRWLMQPAQAGDRPVVILKPTAVGLSTNLVITTDDGHLYDLDLVSRATRFVPEVGFYDPRALVATIQEARAAHAARARARAAMVVASLPRIDPAALDFTYWWKGPRADRPLRVFSAAGKVYIQMPKRLRHRDAPALFVVDRGAMQLVNYALVGSYFVVDTLFREARLVLGTGAHRQVVTIHAGRRPLFSW